MTPILVEGSPGTHTAVVLDPEEVAVDRVELDLNTGPIRVGQEGPDWGDAAVEQYMADLSRGSLPVDYRTPNRQVKIPLLLGADGPAGFAPARAQLQAKVARFQAEGGWLKRGVGLYADVVNAALTLPDKYGGWLEVEPDVVLTLDCLPEFYGDEIELDLITVTTAPEIVAVLEQDAAPAVIGGDYPARCRIVVNESDGDSQLGLLWGTRSRHYSPETTAALAYEAEALTPLDSAAIQALAGASGGNTIRHNNLSTSWMPVLNTNLLAGTFLTHTGSYRVWARVYTTSADVNGENTPKCRFVWDVGDLTFPVENGPKPIPAANGFYLVDLGEIRLDEATGTHRWQGQIQAKGAAGGENVYIDRIWFQPLDEGAGRLRAPVSASVGLAGYSARDEFNQTAGALAGKTAAVGGNWAGAGDADDFTVETAGKTAQRTAVSDADPGRIATLPVAMTATAVQVDFKNSVNLGTTNLRHKVIARFADANNYFSAGVANGSTAITAEKKVAGVATPIAGVTVAPFAVGSWYTLRLLVDSAGRWFLWYGPAGSAAGEPILSGVDAVLATGGALASGNPGFRDNAVTATAATRNYDNFAAWAPDTDAVLHPSQSLELTTEGMFREDASGAAFGPVSDVLGDLPRLPPSGAEARVTELFIKGSRGNLDQLADLGIDDISAQVFYRPCWLAPYSA